MTKGCTTLRRLERIDVLPTQPPFSTDRFARRYMLMNGHAVPWSVQYNKLAKFPIPCNDPYGRIPILVVGQKARLGLLACRTHRTPIIN